MLAVRSLRRFNVLNIFNENWRILLFNNFFKRPESANRSNFNKGIADSDFVFIIVTAAGSFLVRRFMETRLIDKTLRGTPRSCSS